MKVEIWSDVMCPFCYIGKRKFETALAQFPDRDSVQIEWHGFQLDPTITYQPGVNLYSYLAERKGQSLEWSIKMHENVVAQAKAVGLTYNFDKAVIANSMDAHRFVKLANKYGKGDAAEENLFHAYFTDGKNISDHHTLAELGEAIGLDRAEVLQVLATDNYTQDVKRDIAEAQQLGITGVPFFVIDRKYGVSGAQASEVFLNALTQAFAEWKLANPSLVMEGNSGDVCVPGEDCN